MLSFTVILYVLIVSFRFSLQRWHSLSVEFSRQEYWNSILQGIFPAQGSNPSILHCMWILYHLSHQGSPKLALRMLKCTDKFNKYNQSTHLIFTYSKAFIISNAVGRKFEIVIYHLFLFFKCFGHATWHAESQFPDQGLNPRSLQQKHGVLTTGLLGNSPDLSSF